MKRRLVVALRTALQIVADACLTILENMPVEQCECVRCTGNRLVKDVEAYLEQR